MFAPEPPTAAELDAADALLADVEAGWSRADNPADLVPSR